MRSLILAVLVFLGGAVSAADDVDVILKKLQQRVPDLTAEQISPSPIAGLYQFRLGSQVAYVSADGRYLVRGDIIDAATDVNLTEAGRSAARLAAVNGVGSAQMIIFSPKKVKHTVTVFTDIDCGYCRKLHREISQYLAQGIEVRYLFFPRSGPNTESWTKAEMVWCSANRNDAMTQAKQGVVISAKACGTTPVQRHYSLGLELGVQGTPAIITDTGELVPGYVPAGELASYLDEGKAG